MSKEMPTKFWTLVTYNSEIARGIMHTEKWKRKMDLLHKVFNEWQRNVREEA